MLKLTCFLVITLTHFFAYSATVSVKVSSDQAQDLSNVVVYFTPSRPIPKDAIKEIALMDQVNTQFLPHILVIQKDTEVRFPNSDSVKHHVYSFSPANTFELQLYKELQADPLLFSIPGSVELGCNIHDWMLGYIFVVDTPFFGKTDGKGRLAIDLPEGEYQVDIWHPRIQDSFSALSKQIDVPRELEINLKLALPLLPDVNQYEQVTDEFSDYD